MARRSRRAASAEKTLEAAATPVFLLSGQRVVLFFNAGCEGLSGWKSDEVVGERCEYVSDPEPGSLTSLTATLCPPPEALEGASVSVPVFFAHRDGRATPRWIHFVPLQDREHRVTAVLGIVAEILPPKLNVNASASSLWHAELAAQRAMLRARYGSHRVTARSSVMMRVARQLQLARSSNLPVLLTGEPGVGKQHLAHAIHLESQQRNRCFVPLDCRLSPAFELKATLKRLFSHDLGDSPDDSPAMESLFPGTLYLDHVDRLPRDLQEYVVEQATASLSRSKSIRLAAGTSEDLNDGVVQESLRRDFFDLLSTQVISLPPLRARPEDIPLLAQAILEDRNRGADRQRGGFSEDVARQFREYRWPGNIDELRAVVDEAWENGSGSIVQTSELPFRFQTGRDAQSLGPPRRSLSVPLEQHLANVEKEQIERALQMAAGNKSRAAELLGMPRPRLYRRMAALGLISLDDAEADSPDAHSESES